MFQGGNMKKYIMLAIILAVFTASQVVADTLNLTALPVTRATASDNVTYYVGAVAGNINGGTSANFFCDDFYTTTYVPGSFPVLVSSLSNISGTKFVGQESALTKYQQVGWLMNQMEINPVNIAAIQFAMWSVFAPSGSAIPTFPGEGFAGSAAWLDASTKIDAGSYDFSQMRIYTPSGSINQEFIGGKVTAVPEPGEWMLLIIGLGLISYACYRNSTKGVIRIRA
jgi:hypothetical protein